MRIRRNRNQLLILLLVAGFLIGAIYVLGNRDSMKWPLERVISGIASTKLEQKEYGKYLVYERTKICLLFLLLSFFRWQKECAMLVALVVGIQVGGYLSVLCCAKGVRGILVGVISLFPHMIFYGMGIYILLIYWMQEEHRRWNYVKTVVIVILLVLGLLSEVYVNFEVLRKIIK